MFAKHACGKPYRGFESPSHRNNKQRLPEKEAFFVCEIFRSSLQQNFKNQKSNSHLRVSLYLLLRFPHPGCRNPHSGAAKSPSRIFRSSLQQNFKNQKSNSHLRVSLYLLLRFPHPGCRNPHSGAAKSPSHEFLICKAKELRMLEVPFLGIMTERSEGVIPRYIYKSPLSIKNSGLPTKMSPIKNTR